VLGRLFMRRRESIYSFVSFSGFLLFFFSTGGFFFPSFVAKMLFQSRVLWVVIFFLLPPPSAALPLPAMDAPAFSVWSGSCPIDRGRRERLEFFLLRFVSDPSSSPCADDLFFFYAQHGEDDCILPGFVGNNASCGEIFPFFAQGLPPPSFPFFLAHFF